MCAHHIYRYVSPGQVRNAVIEAIPRVLEIGDSALINHIHEKIIFTSEGKLQFSDIGGVPTSDYLHFPVGGILQNNLAIIVSEMMVYCSENSNYIDECNMAHKSVKRRVFDLAEVKACIALCEHINADSISQLIGVIGKVKIIDAEGYRSRDPQF
jgi:hypothetical protein